MKSSRAFSTLLITGALALAAGPAFAQSTAGSASSSGGSSSRPLDPSGASSATATSPSGSTSASTDYSSSGSNGTRGTVTGRSAETTAPASADNSPTVSASDQGLARQFPTLDADSDGRLSASEFSSYSVSSGAAGANSATRGAGGASGMNNSNSTRGGNDASASGSLSAQTAANAQLFQQLDTNHDGYLSRDEISAYRGNDSSAPQH